MKILKFRVWNYKSIVDTQDCYPADKVTILAGRNEAGKSSILEALEDFNAGQPISSKSVPMQDGTALPRIKVWFEFPKKDIQTMLKTIGHTTEIPKTEQVVQIEIQKTYPDVYELGDDTCNKLGFPEQGPVSETRLTKIQEHLAEAAQIHSNNPPLSAVPFPQFTLSEASALRDEVSQFRSALDAYMSSIPTTEYTSLIDHLDKASSLASQIKGRTDQKQLFIEELKKRLPNFILFRSFDDVFPNSVPIAELAANPWIQDLEKISNLDPQLIQSGSQRDKMNHKTQLNVELKSDFEKFWVQDLSNLQVDWDNQNVFFWIAEDNLNYEPEIRSQGKRWYLAFYIRVTARSKEQNNVILIDEPGLYLHAQAQTDVLKKLEEASDSTPVIFSTHSPYLLESEKLNRIRLVMKTPKGGTKVESKIHKVADKETLTPILTAIGLGINNSISQIDRINNVVVEGPSDWYYLQAFKRLLGDEEINFIHGGGAGNMPFVGTILQGWGCKVVYLYDNDQGMKDALKNLNANWVTTTKEMLSKLPIEGSIEDVFTQDAYKKLVLNNTKAQIPGKNSEYAKKTDKVIMAKGFLESLSNSSIKIEGKTKANAEQIFEELRKKFKETSF